MNFAVLAPEINSARMFSGAGSAPMLNAAAAWDGLASELGSAASSFSSVTSVAAVEPVAAFRRMASHVADRHGVAVDIVDGTGESIPFPDNSFDSVHIGLVLCSVDDVAATLGEIRRVLVPRGRLVVLEHVRGEGATGRLQDLVERPWSWLAAGCHPNRRTVDAIAAAGFDTTGLRNIRTPVPFPCKPHLQGFATVADQ